MIAIFKVVLYYILNKKKTKFKKSFLVDSLKLLLLSNKFKTLNYSYFASQKRFAIKVYNFLITYLKPKQIF